MPKITEIRLVKKPQKDNRYWIYVDGKYCASARERTFPSLELAVGDEITCEEIQEREKFAFKRVHAKNWGHEKTRIEAVKRLISAHAPNLKVKTVGFGADSTEFIDEHPEEMGAPDLDVTTPDGELVMKVEVTGTKFMRGDDYWVRPDKLKYASNHPDEAVWIVLHFEKPEEHFVFIRPVVGKRYSYVNKTINGVDEHYVTFTNRDEEVVEIEEFYSALD